MSLNADSRMLSANVKERPALPGRVVLVMQGGGAPGSYQAGAYQALHEAGIEPDWIIGTSIGAINGAIIAGNKASDRIEKLKEFWQSLDPRVPSRGPRSLHCSAACRVSFIRTPQCFGASTLASALNRPRCILSSHSKKCCRRWSILT